MLDGYSGKLNRSDDQRAWVENAHATIRRAGHRQGGARAVLIELFAEEDCALTVQEIDLKLTMQRAYDGTTRSVGIASIYRGVELLQDLQVITRVDVGDGVARYERAPVESSGHHHHHFLCDHCGLLLPFDDDALEEAIDGLESRLGFVTKEHEVTLHGTCRDCR